MPSSISDRIIDYISYVQREKSITKERFYSIRQYFFQSVGFCVLLYFLSQLLKLLFRLIFQIFSIIFWLPLKAMESFLLKSDNYNIMFLLFCLCSVFSFTIAKFSHKKFRQRYSFILTFVIILLLQSLFILLPIATSIQARSKLSSIPIDVKQKIVKLSEIDKMPGQENNFIKNFENNKRAEFIPVNNGVKLNESTKNLTGKMIINSQNKLSSSLGKESDIEDEQNMNTAEKSPTNLQISSNEEQKLLLKQQGNTLVDYTEQFNSKISENSSQFIPEKTEQIEETEKRKISLTFRQKFTNWLDNTRNIFYQTKLDFQKFFSFSKKPLSQYTITTIYTAFTDLNCYDYTKLTHRYKQNYKYFLNAYRHRSPFSIYLSIIKSNGPKCYPYYPNSSCAIRSKLVFSNLKKQLFRFTRFWMIISLLITILIFIYKRLQYKQKYNPLNQSSNKTNELPLQQISSNIPNNPLDKKIENQLRLWLEQEQNDGYQNISESCRKALNTTFSKEYERLNIETLQFTDAKIHHVSQTSIETIVINATLDIDYLIFNVIKDQHFSIKIPKLTGELEILLISNTIEVKFKQIQIDNTEIIDSNNILSSDEKESIIKLLKKVMNQTIVQCCFYLSDNQAKPQPSMPPIVSQSSHINEQLETPIITPINDNNQQIHSEKLVKKLLIRIVKAVKLHDVEQPFCILELNQPKQIHQTSIAKNGLNPFWDEHFLFECNDKSNQIHLQIIDRKKPNKKFNPNNIDTIYADVSIPFSYVTSTIYKQDIQITPQYPDSIIRIEFSTLTEQEANNGYDIESLNGSLNWSNGGPEANKIEHNYRQSPSDEIVKLACNADESPKDNNFQNNTRNYFPSRSQITITDAFSKLLPLTSPDDDIELDKPRKSRSFMNSFRLCSRQKKPDEKGKQNENGLISSFNTSPQTNFNSHTLSSEPTDPTPFRRGGPISRSFRNFFRSNSKKRTLNTNNFIIDHPDLLTTSTPTPKKRSFFRRFKSKRKQKLSLSINSLTSEDCTRTESVRNTPIRANVGRPVTMTQSVVS